MPRISPVSWGVFIKKMKEFGFKGPFQEGKHPYLVKDTFSITIPNPHRGDMSVDLIVRILRQAGISRADWVKNK